MKLTTHALDITRGARRLCVDLELTLQGGEIWAVLGLNGSGKTTLLHTLAGLLPAAQGEIAIEQRALSSYPRRELARHLGVLFQHQQDRFPISVQEAAEQACFPHHALWAVPGPELHARLNEVLQQFELAALAQRDIRTLSGGERQRLAIAMLQIQDPAIWLLDEPANHLDIPHQQSLLTLLQQIAHTRQAAMLLALHDVNQAVRIATHALLLLGEGQWLAGPAEEIITAEHLQQVYGCRFNRVMDEQGKIYWFAQ